jgi:ergothioneine biosynthesis protein EgtB
VQQLRRALLDARERTLALSADYAAALGEVRPTVPHAPELNPPLWELGHIAWFQEWWIARNPARAEGRRCDPLQPRTPSLLPQADTWYDSSRVAHRTRWELPLPDLDATRDYLDRTLRATLRALDSLPADAGDDALYFFRLATAHEQMHAEAAVYMADSLGITLSEHPTASEHGSEGELDVPRQVFRVGHGETEGFTFDNERGAHEVDVGPLRIDARPVSWARYLPFVTAGGYEDARWWSEAGAKWLGAQARRGPGGLRQGAVGWQAWRHGAWVPLQLQEPAEHLSVHEAEAWCRWAGRRLPTEAEWECAACSLPDFQWGRVWEWTASPFEPYPGFTPDPYRDYSAPWFGTRRVLRGACWATAPALVHARYRNFFEPHRRDIFAGFRSVAG